MVDSNGVGMGMKSQGNDVAFDLIKKLNGKEAFSFPAPPFKWVLVDITIVLLGEACLKEWHCLLIASGLNEGDNKRNYLLSLWLSFTDYALYNFQFIIYDMFLLF